MRAIWKKKNTAPHDWSMIGLWPRQVPTSKTHIEWAVATLMMSYIGKGKGNVFVNSDFLY